MQEEMVGDDGVAGLAASIELGCQDGDWLLLMLKWLAWWRLLLGICLLNR